MGVEIPHDVQKWTDCICDRHLFQRENMGTCLYCGHGYAYSTLLRSATERLVRERPLAKTTLALSGAKRTKKHTEDSCLGAALRWLAVMGTLPTERDWKSQNGGPPHPSHATVYRLFGTWNAFGVAAQRAVVAA